MGYVRLAATLFFVGFHLHAFAAPDVSLPTMDVAGIDTANDDPITMVWKYAKYIIKFLLWVGVVWAAASTVFASIKSVNKARKDEESKWGDVVKDIVGHLAVTILVFVLAIWANSFLK